MAGLRLVAGLGNPGQQYAHTRHNVGFMVLDRLAELEGRAFSSEPAWGSTWVRWDEIFLVKPLTYMNRSGEALAPFARYYKIVPDQILVVVDDVALPLGRLRLRGSGSDGGHNGLKSIIASLGENFMRLRIGIGSTGGGDEMLDHVLGEFAEVETALAQTAISRAVEAIRHLAREGLTSAMNHYNAAEKS
jgi:peptidyl-tRNA hydrolase, PTH1 family